MTLAWPLAWGARVSPDFRARVCAITERLGWRREQADHLMAAMAFETGRTFSPSIRNPASSATGLLQFMSATARGLGTTTDALAKMSAVQQLEYVERYFQPHAARIHTLDDLYMAIIWPRAIPAPLEYVLWKTGTRAYAVNRGLDANRDGRVTKAEATDKVSALLYEGRRAEHLR